MEEDSGRPDRAAVIDVLTDNLRPTEMVSHRRRESEAHALLAALDAAGYAVEAKEPSAAQVAAGVAEVAKFDRQYSTTEALVRNLYRAMLGAAHD